MKKILFSLFILFVIVVILVITLLIRDKETDINVLDKLEEQYVEDVKPSVDHSKFDVLKTKFNNANEVTKACLSCHTETHKELMKSNHWSWEREEYIKGRGIVYIGKKNAVNNFCIGVKGNEKSCAKCHIGFGMTHKMEAYTDSVNIDCMVCHDNTESYIKGDELGGEPDPSVDLNNIAVNVGKPKRSNCGVCHFFSGGGNNTKHGDLEMAMFEPTKEVDVHMAVDGVNLQCVACHKTEKHNMLGKIYTLSSMNRNRSTCEQCHTETPHDQNIINEHTIKVACQTCHIPVYAKVNSTKMYWDWSTAGKLSNGEPYREDDEFGNYTYLSIKGSAKWERNIKPDYIWFNGTASHYLLGDKIEDTAKTLVLNPLNGSYGDKESKIYPVKLHKAKQPFDPVTGILIQPKLFADNKGEGAFWKDFDWYRASEIGMKDVNLPFSGKISFIETQMNWLINHMVSEKEKSVQCIECHTRNNSRIANLKDFYIPGRDYSSFIEFSGKSLLVLTFAGVVVHGFLRIRNRKRIEIKK